MNPKCAPGVHEKNEPDENGVATQAGMQLNHLLTLRDHPIREEEHRAHSTLPSHPVAQSEDEYHIEQRRHGRDRAKRVRPYSARGDKESRDARNHNTGCPCDPDRISRILKPTLCVKKGHGLPLRPPNAPAKLRRACPAAPPPPSSRAPSASAGC